MTDLVPRAVYLLVAGRVDPRLDAGFAVAVMRRARDLRRAGGESLVLTVNVAATGENDRIRDEWIRRGVLAERRALRNLYDDLRADRSWLIEAARPLPAPAAGFDENIVRDDAGEPLVALPVVTGDPAWMRSDAAVTVYDAAGQPAGWLPGFGGLYRAWLNHIAPEAAAQTGLTPVIVCEARQIGEVLVADAAPPLDPALRIVHETHANHTLPPHTWDAPMADAWTSWLDTAARYDAVTWLTPTQRADVERRFGPEVARSFVAPHPAPPVVRAREPRVPGRVVMLNSLSTRKRVDHALRALALVRAEVPHAHLHVHGDGPERSALEALAADLGIADAVTWHGYDPDPLPALASAQALLLTSTNEAQGLVVVEALSHGVPVVAYDIPYGPRDMLAHGGGTVVPDGEVPALAAALQALLTSPERAAREEEAYASAEAQGFEPSLRAFGDAVREALSGPPRR
ncbi:glycosyltransferase [Microbacterium sp. Marseille-Q6965]|uniref:glycosyltransferase n=1 Tax=Microbacterium sp. Marseille-Q6965 TaxID=2965072 RepID=UPI0021B83109|nr:glycosyltransferase [Microbacterium sp. Marseille-Q6965]